MRYTRKQQTEIYKRAREIISAPENWTKDAMAKDTEGNVVASCNSEAVSFCSEGALNRACYDLAINRLHFEKYAYFPMGDLVRGFSWIDFNDRSTTTHQMVLNQFDKVIAHLDRPWWKFW